MTSEAVDPRNYPEPVAPPVPPFLWEGGPPRTRRYPNVLHSGFSGPEMKIARLVTVSGTNRLPHPSRVFCGRVGLHVMTACPRNSSIQFSTLQQIVSGIPQQQSGCNQAVLSKTSAIPPAFGNFRTPLQSKRTRPCVRKWAAYEGGTSFPVIVEGGSDFSVLQCRGIRPNAP